ncbi:beta-ketoacyl-ACP synthase III [Desulfovibrio sp. 86]|uniref:Beta-ketoacyl-[acyl-carrier-protein] synthase III n=1 Tax=uncultured Desulfovibrio sp. TaxID=167968 RepID=A0A212LAX1_9BACT|nr:beta-ketoacyl-ACP synthase III [Desulfovibrio sp. 86]SCM74640.1 3-oxoacyl-(acyl-carrier-protein) synthase 3 [uncultured Desulfovibrio sp.]VZH34957.1 3-oxoacyl-[acyl-carrier-protein] synthase 3 [Desulfovibrio sp. 86]
MNPLCHLLALSAYVPDAVLTNEDLAKVVDTNEEWIVTRTGIKQRHRLADDENTSDLGLKAARKALADAGMEASELTHVIAATCTPDVLSPSVACIMAGQLGTGPVMAFDFGAACSGFIYGLSICRALLAQQPEAKILFVCTEALTRRVNWADRSTCVLFGDAATACIVASSPGNVVAGLEDVICQSDGTQRDLIVVGGGTSSRYAKGDPVSDDFFITMQGRETYKHAVRNMVHICEDVLTRNGLTAKDVNLLVPHQANMRIIEAVGSRLDMTGDRVFVNVDKYGNTSSASIPLAITEARAAGRIKAGDRMLVTAFGAGLTWGAALLRF